jgi:rhodanese-related sulfurtransferase
MTVVLDVRTEEEFRSSTGRLERALLLPLQDLERRIGELSPYKERAILVYCRSGVRSRNAVAILEKSGYKALNLEGGILEWSNQGLPVILESLK